MKLKKIPTTDEGLKDFSGVDLSKVTATERQFAEIVGISPSMTNRLKKYGVLIWSRFEGINLQKSLREYWYYLNPNKQDALKKRLAANCYDIFL